MRWDYNKVKKSSCISAVQRDLWQLIGIISVICLSLVAGFVVYTHVDVLALFKNFIFILVNGLVVTPITWLQSHLTGYLGNLMGLLVSFVVYTALVLIIGYFGLLLRRNVFRRTVPMDWSNVNKGFLLLVLLACLPLAFVGQVLLHFNFILVYIILTTFLYKMCRSAFVLKTT